MGDGDSLTQAISCQDFKTNNADLQSVLRLT
jgi:hypothetical protein